MESLTTLIAWRTLAATVRRVSQSLLIPMATTWSFLALAQSDLPVEPIYSYAVQSMDDANWLYLGFAPRVQDPKRVKIYISKRGYTLRAVARLNAKEVADYPSQLVRRADAIEAARKKWKLEILQSRRYQAYQKEIEEIRRGSEINAAFSKTKFRQGLKLLAAHFPKSIVLKKRGDSLFTELHFVYPITINKSGPHFPQAKTYHTYVPVEERRSLHAERNKVRKIIGYNHVFGGFPAFWLSPEGAGVGVHGPIRFTSAEEKPKDKAYKTMESFWKDNQFLNQDYDPLEDFSPRYRWDLIRTNNSKGCFRTEPMELRHILPSDPSALAKVPWQVLDEFDRVQFRRDLGPEIVNVEYYLFDHYAKPDPEAWLNLHFLTAEERKQKQAQETLKERLKQTRHFPYLDPSIVEFRTPNQKAAPEIMRHLNRL